MDQTPGTTVSNNLTHAARTAELRLEQWYQARGLQLPVEAQAEFTAMAFEAIARHPQRDAQSVMDDLIGELDERLGHIKASSMRAAPRNRTTGRRGLLHRLRKSFSR